MKKEELLKFYQTYKLYIFPAGVILSSLILIAFIIYPQVNSLLTGQKTKAQFLERSKFLEAKAQTLQNYASEDLNIKVEYALNSYPVEKDLITGIGLIQNITAGLGFSIKGMTLGPGTLKVSNSQSYGMKLDLSGPAALLPSLLTNIENSPRLMRVTSLETTAGGDRQAVSVGINVDVLYATAPQNFGSIDSAVPQLSAKDEQILAKIVGTGSRGGQLTGPQIIQLPPRGKLNPFE